MRAFDVRGELAGAVVGFGAAWGAPVGLDVLVTVLPGSPELRGAVADGLLGGVRRGGALAGSDERFAGVGG
ncbi:hypothetical protein GCM10009534_28930 [Kribbella sandramycini]